MSLLVMIHLIWPLGFLFSSGAPYQMTNCYCWQRRGDLKIQRCLASKLIECSTIDGLRISVTVLRLNG